MKKRLLVLGGGDAQARLIRTGKSLGYYVIVCDMRTGLLEAKEADKFYQQDYMDKEAVYRIAKQEKIDGIISNSEPAMETVSYIVDKMNFPGNSEESIHWFLSKEKFRELQRSCGVYAPKNVVCATASELTQKIKRLKKPILIKPVESSGTRGGRTEDYSKEVPCHDPFYYARSGGGILSERPHYGDERRQYRTN